MTDIYVSPVGSSINDGSLQNPFKSIAKAFSIAKAGDNILLRSGTFRERIDIFKGPGTASQPVTIKAFNNEVVDIRGSDIMTDWKLHSGKIWKITDLSVNPQQVFVDFDIKHKYPLTQIGSPGYKYTSFCFPSPIGVGFADMKPGSFFYDTTSKTLYVWLEDGSSPNDHAMEVSTRSRILFIDAPHVHIKGINFYHSSILSEQGAAVELGNNGEISNCRIQYMDFAGLQMGYMKSDTKAYDCDISFNGNSGINAAASKNFLVNNVTMNYNNYRNFNPLWHGGGLKAATDAYGIVENCEAAYNLASGIWFDYCNAGSEIIVRNNHIFNNEPKEAGIFIEVGDNTKVYGNLIENNTRRGIYISASTRTEVYNNTVIGIKGYSGIEIDGMPRSGASLVGNKVHHNKISGGTSNYDLVVAKPNGTTIQDNTCDFNEITRDSGDIIFMSGGTKYYTIEAWRKATGLDINSNLNIKPTEPPVVEPPVEEPPVDIPEEPKPEPTGPVIKANTTTVTYAELKAGAVYSGIVNLKIEAESDTEVSSIALYINGVLHKRASGRVMYFVWDTTKLSSNKSYTFYITAIDAKYKLSKISIKVYIK